MTLSSNEIRAVITRQQIIDQLRANGISEGMTLMVHSSLRAFGYVCGGAQTVVDALLEAVGYEGTIVVSMQSGDNSEPSYWQNPPVAIEFFDIIRKSHPSFHINHSDVSKMGAISKSIRHREGSVMTHHPAVAFCAMGKYARFICRHHELDFPLSKESPLGACYDLKAHVLLLGVGYDSCTALHLAESISSRRAVILQGGAVEGSGGRIWQKYLDYDYDADDFKNIGLVLEHKNLVTAFKIGNAHVKFFEMQTAVDEAVAWIKERVV
ncbi:MAG: AAC(3) family N-acetyltransferase [Firmicutes bacterium HGW-Firmicutes-10]|jgi:aminoglycoside 3-N-acetyltransferase|nr:MAG: AAC(3) family N-acetyltransferase [Firmicutes bacterium HGW-Firmicutes-10]